jgi:ribonuclease III
LDASHPSSSTSSSQPFAAGQEPTPSSLAPEREADLLALTEMLGLSAPNCYAYYDQALTHSSYTYETGASSLCNYERLEFLGDAVLKLLISDYLFERFPHYREGELTKIRAVVVSDAVLAQIADKLDLGVYMVFGASEARSGGARKQSNLACALEALLGALYLDGKLEEARHLLQDLLEDITTEVDLSKTKDNFKAVLQEYSQGENWGLPHYRVVKEEGPSHSRRFYIEVRLNDEILGYGQGKTKKEAQQSAARVALEALNVLDANEQTLNESLQ